MKPLPQNPSRQMPTHVPALIWGPNIGHLVAEWWPSGYAGAEHGEGFYLTWDHSFIEAGKVALFEVLHEPTAIRLAS